MENILKNKSFSLAIEIVQVYKHLIEEKREFVMSKQLLRSGTSVGAMVRESQNAESKNDFIHKFKIAAKEGDETEYFLKLCQFSKTYPFRSELLDNLDVIMRIISKIISTSKGD